MRWVKAEQTGHNQTMSTGEGPGYSGQPVEKTVGVLSGNAHTVYYQGIKLWVDDEDTIIRGPDLLIGYEWSRVKQVPWTVFWDIASSLNRGVTIMNNKNLSPEERAAAKVYEDAKIRMAKAIDSWNESRYEKLAPGTVSK